MKPYIQMVVLVILSCEHSCITRRFILNDEVLSTSI